MPSPTPTPTPAARPATATPAAPAPQAEQQPTVAKTDDTVDASAGTYVVAPGRTVFEPGEKDGDVGVDRKPGEKVKLSAGEAERLLKLGFILDKDGAVFIRADGPAVNTEDGVQIAPQQ